ncbi:hypothetical protein ACLB2K_012316 [Fragaria x ananassa]
MAVARVLGGGAAMASMTARLISKLSLRQEDEPVDLKNLKSPGTGFVGPRFYLVGKLTQPERCNLILFEVPSKRCGDYLCWWRCHISAGRETIGPILKVDQVGLRRGSTLMRVMLPLNSPVRMDRRLRLSPEDVIKVQYRYERLVGLCKDCLILNHGGFPCPNAQETEEGTGALVGLVVAPAAPPIVFRANSQVSLVVPSMPALFREKRPVQIRDVAMFPSPTKVTGIVCNWEEDEIEGGKRLT